MFNYIAYVYVISAALFWEYDSYHSISFRIASSSGSKVVKQSVLQNRKRNFSPNIQEGTFITLHKNEKKKEKRKGTSNF